MWTRLDGGDLSMWTAIINEYETQDIISLKNTNNLFDLEQNKPNPFSDETYISYKLYHDSQINLALHDIYGKKITCIVKNKNRTKGKHIEKINKKDNNLSEGVYFYSIISENKIITKKMIIVN